jgi:hypothetical protein
MRWIALTAVIVAVLAAACGGGDSGTGASSDPAGKPLSVAEALKAAPGDVVRVHGGLIAPDGGQARLCSAILESYPPQCGGPSLVVHGLDLSSLTGLSHTSDPSLAQVTWSDREIVLTGTVRDGVLTVPSA